MKNAKRILSILMACAMLMMVMPMAVAAEGTQDNPINANDKWFGNGVNTYLLNPTIAEGTTDGVWYTFSPEQDGILVLEHKYKNVDYDITIDWYGLPYTGSCVDGVTQNSPIMTLPVSVGDPITVHIATKDGAAGTVYANMKIVTGTVDDPVKVKSADFVAYVGAGQTVYFQDDTLNADYAAKGVELQCCDTVFYNVSVNSTSGAVTETAVTDSDGDGYIETTLGGSLGGSGVPPVKPMWAIQCNNDASMGLQYTMDLVDSAHECNWDDDADADCNTCGASREVAQECQHVYDHAFDAACNLCGEAREVAMPLEIVGNSVSADVNGLAWLVEAKVDGITLNGTTANYDNATLDGCKLITMGAVVSNNYAELSYVPNLDGVDGVRTIDVQAKYIYDTNEEAGTVTYAIRLINIPNECKDHRVDILTYVIYEDADGVQHTLYCNSANNTYNQFT